MRHEGIRRRYLASLKENGAWCIAADSLPELIEFTRHSERGADAFIYAVEMSGSETIEPADKVGLTCPRLGRSKNRRRCGGTLNFVDDAARCHTCGTLYDKAGLTGIGFYLLDQASTELDQLLNERR